MIRPMDHIAALRAKLDEAEETIRQLKETIRPGGLIWYNGLELSRVELVIMNVLLIRTTPISQSRLRMAVDTAMAFREPGSPKSIDVRMVYLRRKLWAVDPPITIKTSYGFGFFMDDENKARLLARRRDITSEVS
jgi:hypothetical protein